MQKPFRTSLAIKYLREVDTVKPGSLLYYGLIFFALSARTCCPAVLATPDITITGLTHYFSHAAPAGPATWISDSTAADQFNQTGFTYTITGFETVVSHFEAQSGKKFVIHSPPAGFGEVQLYIDAEWYAGPDGGSPPPPTTAKFEGLAGAQPVMTSSESVIGAGGKWVRFQVYFTILPGTEFTGVELSTQASSIVSTPESQLLIPLGGSFSAQVASGQTLPDGMLMTLESVPAPSLSIVRVLPGIAVSWPTNFSNWTLESATQLGTTNGWAAVTNVPTIVDSNLVVTNLADEPTRCYRLRAP